MAVSHMWDNDRRQYSMTVSHAGVETWRLFACAVCWLITNVNGYSALSSFEAIIVSSTKSTSHCAHSWRTRQWKFIVINMSIKWLTCQSAFCSMCDCKKNSACSTVHLTLLYSNAGSAFYHKIKNWKAYKYVFTWNDSAIIAFSICRRTCILSGI